MAEADRAATIVAGYTGLLLSLVLCSPALAAPVERGLADMVTVSDTPLPGLVQFQGGCAGTIVSATGLILTTANCVEPCLRQVDNESLPALRDGFAATSRDEELRCPYLPAWHRAAAAHDSEGNCAEPPCAAPIKQLSDLRLVWAPESAIRNFGAHLEQGNTPRHALDAALLRWWEHGEPASTGPFAHALRASEMPMDAMLRLPGIDAPHRKAISAAELGFRRDHALTAQYDYSLHVLHSLPPADALHRKHQARASELRQHLQTLRDAELMRELVAADNQLRQEINNRGKWRRRYAHIHPRLEILHQQKAELVWPLLVLSENDHFWSERYLYAQLLLDGQQDPAQPELFFTQQLYRQSSQSHETETLRFAKALEYLRDRLGYHHPVAQELLGKRAPTQVAHDLLSGTELQDVHLRRRLWESGPSDLQASTDPLLGFARRVAALARGYKTKLEDLQSEEQLLNEQLIEARQAVFDEPPQPPAPAFISVRVISPPATMGSLFLQAGPFSPFALPARWWSAETRLPATLALSNSLAGNAGQGFRGAPVLNEGNQVQGLIIEPTADAARKQYRDEPQRPGVIALHSAALLQSLREVYQLDWLLGELRVVD